jgi:phospholipid transport system substrate-binding protein
MANIINRLVLGLFLLVSVGNAQVFASTPTEQIQETIQQVLLVVSGSPNGSEEERKDMLKDALMPRFDWFEMAKQALGKRWNDLSDRKSEFVAAFAEFLRNSYAGQIGSYKGEKILFVHETVEKNLAQVDTKIIPSKGEPISLNYRLHRVQEEWKIYDVVVDNVGLMDNYRSQFNRILATSSLDDLIKRLKEKRSDKS